MMFCCRRAHGPDYRHRGSDDSAGDVVGMREALMRVMGDEGLRRELGPRASASVRERYALEIILKKWDEIFEEVCA